jgi:phosphodiesterase/alkaline phosphatase D-like protein
MLIGGCGNPHPKPNILLVTADDWSWPHASSAGEPEIRTPASGYMLSWSPDTLKPHTRYFYRLEYGTHYNLTRQVKAGSFTTLQRPDSDVPN